MIDARGLLCPQPVILTKKELDKAEVEEIETLVDNEVAVNNLKKLAESLGASAEVETIENYFSVKIKKGAGFVAAKNEDLVIAFSQDHMGDNEELGHILIKSFIYTLTEAVHKPKEILLFNSAVKLVTSNSEVLADLKKLAEEGVNINACGLCLDFFQLKEDVQVGGITNMYDIYEKMAQAGHLIRI